MLGIEENRGGRVRVRKIEMIQVWKMWRITQKRY